MRNLVNQIGLAILSFSILIQFMTISHTEKKILLQLTLKVSIDKFSQFRGILLLSAGSLLANEFMPTFFFFTVGPP